MAFDKHWWVHLHFHIYISFSYCEIYSTLLKMYIITHENLCGTYYKSAKSNKPLYRCIIILIQSNYFQIAPHTRRFQNAFQHFTSSCRHQSDCHNRWIEWAARKNFWRKYVLRKHCFAPKGASASQSVLKKKAFDFMVSAKLRHSRVWWAAFLRHGG